MTPPATVAPRPFVLPAIVLGIGLGGFLDGLVLHEILGWHHMISAVDAPVTVEALRQNVLADGLFHAVAWIVTVAGVFLLWRAIEIAKGRPRRGVLGGGLLVGFAVFNLVEGVIDHLVLGVHHVRDGPDAAAYDVGFLALSALVFVAGSAILRRALRPSAADEPNGQRQAATDLGGG
jgi:uncharacterized membrane protein